MSCNSNCDDTEVIIVTLNTGAPGSATGIPGPQGPQGEQGEQGPQGEPGIMSAVTGDVAITTTSVSTLATVGVAAIVGGAAQALTLQTDAKGRVLAVTAQQASITTAQIQSLVIPDLSNAAGAALATAGASGISGASARADHVHPFPTASEVGALGATAAAGGDLTGNFPNPTLAAVTTAQSSVGSASAVPVLTVDDKGRVTALNTVALNALTTQDIAGLTTQPAQSLGAVASAGVSPLAARGDHIHPLPSAADVGALGATAAAGGDLAGNFPNPTLAAITTAQNGVGSQTAIPVISIDAKGRVTALESTALNALTTQDIAGLSTTAPLSLAPSASAGTSDFAARADHVHALTTLGTPGTFGSGTVVPVLTVDNYGRVSAVTTTEITGGGGGASLTTQPAQSLATTASAGVSTEAARADHVHPYPTPAQIGAISTTAQAGFATTTQLANYAPLESPALTGSPTAPTAAAGTDTTQLATTAFVQSNRGDRYKATSTTPLTIGNGVKTLTVETGLSYTVTQEVSIVYDLDNHMHGVVTSYNGSTLVVEVSQHSGSGSFSAWVINVGGLTTAAGALLSTNNLSDVASTTTALTNLGGVSTGRQIIAGSGLTGGGDFTADRTMSLTTSGVTAGSYNTTAQLATLTVDQFGRVTNVSQQAFPTGVNFTRVKVVGQDAATVQGCIDAITTATYNAQWWVLIPPGEYTENLTLKACVNLAALGTNNGVSRITQINGSHTYAGSATAANNYIQISGISLNGNSSGTPALSLTSTGGNSSLVHLLDCRIVHPGAQTSEVVVRVGSNVFVTAFNVTTASVTATGQGGTHWDINNGSVEAHCCRNIGGTRAVLLRGSDGTAYYPYLDSRNSYWEGSGSETIKIDSTGTNALAVFGNSNIKTTGSGVTNGIDIQAAGALVGASSTSYQVPVGASNYVVTGVAGSGYFEANNHYSNTAALPYYSTQFGASVLRQQYATAFATTAMAAISTSSLVGLSSYPARADHSHALTTQSVANILSATAGAALTTTGIVGISSLVARADHTHALTTAGIGNVLSTTPGAALTTTGIAGTSAFAARVDHTHALTTQATGNVLTTTPGAALTTTAIAGVSPFVARVDHTHPLPTAVQIGALTTDQINSLSTATPATLTTSGVVGLSVYPARMDHSHAMATLGVAATYGSSSAVPVITTDAFGRVASVTTAAISGGGGGATLTSQPAANLTTAGYAGLLSGTEAARADHSHALTTSAVQNIVNNTVGAALTTSAIAGTSTFVSRVDHTHAIPTTFQLSALFQAGLTVANMSTQGEGSLSGGNMLIGNGDGGAYLGRVGVKEEPLSVDTSVYGSNFGISGNSLSDAFGSIACSSDGKYVTAGRTNTNSVQVSTNFGATWANTLTNITGIPGSVCFVAMSADGKYQLFGSQTLTLSNSSNYGANWTVRESARNWSACAMSSDGKYQTACVDSATTTGYIYTSSNFGVTWTARATDAHRTWKSVAMSSDGRIQYAVTGAFTIYGSTNYGATWTQLSASVGGTGLCVNADGRYIFVFDQASGSHFYSSNYGASFVTLGNWGAINIPQKAACSSDGRNLVALGASVLRISTNYGATNTLRDAASAWSAVAMSSDGRVIYATVAGGYIYRYTAPAALTGSLSVSDKAAIGVALTTTETASLAVGSGGIKAWNAALTAAPTITVGDATPEGAVTAPVGSLFLRTNGGANTTLYVKESGTGNTGWVGK